MALDLNAIAVLATAGRDRLGYSTDPAWIMAKVTEEVGEVARALVGEYERRPDRGSVASEAAQAIILLAVLVHITHPATDLDAVVRAELVALQALAE